MGRFFSPSTGAFYSEAVHGQRTIAEPLSEREAKAGKRPREVENPACGIPADAMPLADARYADLMEAQNAGRQIVVRGGKPVAIDPLVSAEERAAIRRRQRDRLLAASDWTQLADAAPVAGREAWANYRQQLRDLDMSADDWPPTPDDAEFGA